MSLWGWLFRRHQREQELDEEVQAHLRMAAQERMEQGETAEQARAAAVREFGNVSLVKEVTRDVWGFRWLETLLQDLRYGLRQLSRNPGFTAVAVLTLALGIGATTAIFSLVDAVLLKMLPVQEPEELYRLTSVSIKGRANDYFSYSTFKLLEANNQSLSGVIAFRPMENVDFVVNGNAELARAQAVSGSYFTTLGVKPVLGRTITAEDDARGASPVATISYGYWTARFSRNPSVAGARITLNGAAFTVIGVTPPEFFGLEPGESVDVSIPLASLPVAQPQFAATGTPYFLEIVSSVSPGATVTGVPPSQVKAGGGGAAGSEPVTSPPPG